MKKMNKAAALVLSTAMLAGLGCGCDNYVSVNADTQAAQTIQTANVTENGKGILDGFKIIKVFNFNDKYANIVLKNDKYTVERRKDKNVTGHEKQALFRIDGKKIVDYTSEDIEVLSNGCVFARNYLYSNSMKLANTKVTRVYNIDDNYILARLKKKYDYRIFDSKGKVVKKIKNRSDLISVIKEYKLFNYYFDEGIDETDFKEENFKNNLVKFNLVQNAANGTISNKDGKEIATSKDNIHFYNNCYAVNSASNKFELYNATGTMIKSFDWNFDMGEESCIVFSDTDGKRALISSEYGSGTIYIVDLESGKTKEMNIKSKNSKFNSRDIRFYEDLNVFSVTFSYADSGEYEYEVAGFYDLDGNNVFKNNDEIKVREYLGNGYFSFTKNNKLCIGLLKSFPEVKATKLVKKIRLWKDYPKATKIKKTKKNGNTLNITLKKVKKVKGYAVKVYSTEINALNDIKPVTFKSKKPLVKVNLKKFKNKKKLYVKVYTYVKDIDGNQLKTYSYDFMVKEVKVK
ncbi:hypothetical protein SAMN02745111_01852 [Eubacterium uniforme]|uniref:Arylsulfotransferase (ASST) n=1 Tax=Eubacterium uniforme TaxID=39495 RepID=A0A1T4VWY6_9FIRM|nr:hypothetical protein [Eubacterium uniforme]SKA69447.1 hypothetical protein SAMN02745111_01852 [Eubacterium uniforme]